MQIRYVYLLTGLLTYLAAAPIAVQYLPQTLEACLKDKGIRAISPSSLRKRVAERSAW